MSCTCYTDTVDDMGSEQSFTCKKCAEEQERIEQLETDAEVHCECGNWKDPDAHLCQACLADAEKSMREVA